MMTYDPYNDGDGCSISASQAAANIIRSLGALAHFDPSYSASWDGTDGAWTDRIGGYVVSSPMPGTGVQTLVYSSSLAGLNGLPGWTGTAASTRLQGAAALAALIDGVAPNTFYLVHKTTAAGAVASGPIAGIGSTTLTQFAYTGISSAPGEHRYARRDGAATTSANGAVAVGTNLAVVSSVFDGALVNVWSNGDADIVNAANTRSVVSDLFVIGAVVAGAFPVTSFNGLIGDVAVFPGAHSTSTRETIQNALAAKYGL